MRTFGALSCLQLAIKDLRSRHIRLVLLATPCTPYYSLHLKQAETRGIATSCLCGIYGLVCCLLLCEKQWELDVSYEVSAPHSAWFDDEAVEPF